MAEPGFIDTGRQTARRGAVALLLATLALLVFWLGLWLAGSSAGAGRPEPDLGSAAFHDRVAAMVGAGDTGRSVDGLPVVRPPADDVYLLLRRWAFYPALELDPGRTYRLHLLAEDVVHSAVIAGRETLLFPGQVQTLSLTAPAAGRVAIQCGEYCGLGHTKMIGHIVVAAPP